MYTGDRMKKFLAALLVFLLIPSALSEKYSALEYDHAAHDYEGRIAWATDARIFGNDGMGHEVLLLHTLNLKTGKHVIDELCDAYTIQGSDVQEGFLVARERENRVWIYNVKTGFDSELLFTRALNPGWWNGDIPMSVLAYMNDCIYYIRRITDDDRSYLYNPVRMTKDGETYVYQAPYAHHAAISPTGICAWTESDDFFLRLESPEKGVFLELSAYNAGGADHLYVAGWLNETELLFWIEDYMAETTILHTLNAETGEFSPYTDKKGREITCPAGHWPYQTAVTIDEDQKIMLYMDEVDEIFDLYILDLSTGENIPVYSATNQYKDKSTSDKFSEYNSEGCIPVFFAD